MNEKNIDVIKKVRQQNPARRQKFHSKNRMRAGGGGEFLATKEHKRKKQNAQKEKNPPKLPM
ncbi:MAG: hypothetical protein LBT53_09635 [Puniceicoccales bacterium]|jgi:hypothetical protein|nr:hypothetical protein [Puniceicoccales bacterium]